MKGNAKIIDILNKLLAGELTSMDQYFTHSRMYEDWGFHKLYERIDHEMDDEKQHADSLIRRILFLEGVPAVGNRSPLKIGKDVPEMLENDLELERSVVVALRNAIAVCEQEQDYQTREILEAMLADTEEDHAHWLEKQLGLIKKVGLQNYLQTQM
ncbi:bacterioferritin [Nitrosomonas sp. Is37]|uniref:bacterioferritin n=1 Tax=Nitrosomonas sp. Is37 TaxID=3080535 RepID=UPI00294B1E49|nr:bacterioferritin [Nitrosomonas sp. Is37]MDV6344923.1 bacterioferritin [Nitrosomonas sp. Is37]